MATLLVEKLGGLAGFGGTHAHIRSHGQIETEALSSEDQEAVDALFQGGGAFHSDVADSFRYRISRTSESGTESVEVPEASLPAALASCVRDEFV